ncbi:hypothetical protein BRC65_04315 [Halobacteriales archaeon QH_2_65_14]|nr:MAG: hypothetical protein BRC65_04315 [Halobacteriales archaeon QH_2_65_14]
MSSPEFVRKADPDEAFTLLADENRVEILRALWNGDHDAMAFSELREATGIRDSGQFNYHLDKLLGQFVARSDDGYELTQAGHHVNGAIEAGAYTIEATMEPMTLDDPCRLCGETRTFSYEDETVQVECPGCEMQSQFGVPPSVFLDCERAEIPAVAGEYLRKIIDHVNRGFCIYCDGHVDPRVSRVIPEEAHDEAREEMPEELVDRIGDIPIVTYECRRCGVEITSGLRLTFHNHPAVAGFFYDHDVDVRDVSLWEFATFLPDHERILGADPFRASVSFELDGDELTLVVDDELAVVNVEEA